MCRYRRLLGLAVAVWTCAAQAPKGADVIDRFFEGVSEPLEMKFRLLPLHDAVERKNGAVAPSQASSYLEPYANARLNSRLPYALPVGHWSVEWSAELPEYMHTRFVLQSGERLMVDGERQWLLFDSASGREIARGEKGRSEVYLDSDTGGFYYIDRNDYVATHDAQGGLLHLCGARLLEQYDRLAIWRDGDAYFIVSRSWGKPPRGKGYLWAVEKVRLGDTSKMDFQKVLKDRKREGMVSQRVETLVTPPRYGNIAVLATQSRFYLMDQQLKITEAIAGEFTPLAVSLDDEGHIHALVRSGEIGKFWIVTKAGDRLVDLALELAPDVFPAPPVIDSAGRVYVLLPGEIVAIESGKVIWRDKVDGLPLGTVTLGPRLLIAVGASVMAFDPKGKGMVLSTVAGEQFRTPPVIDAHGHLYVASDRKLYCFKARN